MSEGAVQPDPTTLGPARRKPGPVARLSRTAIADAAIEVGFDELTVVAVASRLGVAPGALYRYVSDRDDLVVAAVDRLLDQLPTPPADDWRGFLESEAWIRWRAAEQHPGLPGAWREAGRASTATRRRYVHCLRVLADLGFGPGDALLAVDAVLDLVNDAVHQAAVIASATAAGRTETILGRWVSGLGEAFERAAADVLADTEAFFARKLRIVLAGIEAVVGDNVERPSPLA